MFNRKPGMIGIAIWTLLLVWVPAAISQEAGSDPDAQNNAARQDSRRRTPVVEVVDKTREAVVNISSTQIIEVRSPFRFDSLFNDIFDFPLNSRRRQIKQTSVGSGFVIHSEGYIVTNAHVVSRTAERKVIFADGSEYEANVVAIDEQHDLAILKIESEKSLLTIELGSSDDLMIGETVIAIGNPLGYQHTVTTGVVSATGRELVIDEHTTFENLIQTDASINPGNSGGPLLNILGQLVGINTAIRADAQNIGFAISVDQLRRLMPEMLDVERRYQINTGLSVIETNDENGPVVKVSEVQTNSPAEEIGLRDLEVYIDAIDGKPVNNLVDYYISLIGKKPGQVIELSVHFDDGKQRTLKLRLDHRSQPDGGKLLLSRFGIDALTVTPKLAKDAGIRNLRGLIIASVEQGGPSQRVGLERGDVIIQIGRYQPRNLEEVGQLLEKVQSGDEVYFGILRISGRSIYRTGANLTAK